MLREMIPLLLLFLKIVLSNAQAEDNVQQNQLPDGRICLFTCSEWIFEEKIQQFAPSADFLGPGYLSKHKIGFPSDDTNSQGTNNCPKQYQNVWGAVYSFDQTEYDAVLKQSQAEYSVPFASNEDVFVVKHNEMNCLVVDLGIQPGDHPPWRHFNVKIPNQMQDDAYYNRLAQIGVPQDYITGLRNASTKPQLHPIIPQDYHPKQDNVQPEHHQYDNNQPISGQVPETRDQEKPGLSVQDVPPTTTESNRPTWLPGVPNPNTPVNDVPPTTMEPNKFKLLPGVPNPNTRKLLPGVPNPNTRKLLPGVPNPNTRKLLPGVPNPNTRKLLPGVPNPNTQSSVTNDQPKPDDVEIVVPKDVDSGVSQTPDGQPVVYITPLKLPESSDVQSNPDDVQIAVPKDIDSGVSKTPDGQPVVYITPLKLPENSNVQSSLRDDVPIAVPKDVDSGVSQTPDGQPIVYITPLKLPESSNVPSNPDDIPIAVPKDVDSGVTQTPDGQPVVYITPLKLPDSSNAQSSSDDLHIAVPKYVDSDVSKTPDDQSLAYITPLESRESSNAQPSLRDDVPIVVPKDVDSGVSQTPYGQPIVYITPLKSPDSSTAQPVTAKPIPLNGFVPTNPEKIDDTTPTAEIDLTRPILTPLNESDLTSAPVGQDYKVQTSPSQQPNYGKLTFAPKTIGNDYSRPKDVPPMLLGAPKQQTQVVPDYTTMNQPVTQQQPNDQPFLGPDTFSPPKLPVQDPSLLINPAIKNEPLPQSLPTLYDIPYDHETPGSNSGLLTLSPNSNLTPTYQNDSPLMTLQNTPSTDQHIPNTIDLHNGPDHLPSNAVSNNLPLQDHTPYSIPPSFGVSKPDPVLPQKPMFEFDQTQPNHVDTPDIFTSTSGNDQSVQPTQISEVPNTLQLHSSSDQTLHPIPVSFGVPKPLPVFPDKPMFTLGQRNRPNKQIPNSDQIIPRIMDASNNPDLLNTNAAPDLSNIQPKNDFSITQNPNAHQINPKTLDVNINPDLLNVHTVPDNLHLHLHNERTVHPIPASFDAGEPAPFIPNKPMFEYNKSNYPSSTIPATFGVPAQPPKVQYKPMFSLDSSPTLRTPKSSASDTPSTADAIPDNSLSQPHATGFQPNPADHQNKEPNQLVSQPSLVPQISATPDSNIVHYPDPDVDNNGLNQFTSPPNHVTTDIPQLSKLQAPNPLINNGNSAPSVAKLGSVAPTASPLVVGQNNNPDQLISEQPHDVTSQLTNTSNQDQAPKVPLHHISPPTYTPSTFMVSNYTPVSPVLGYSFAYRYPQYLHNSTYKPPNCYYQLNDLIPGFVFGSNIQLY